MSWGQGGYMGCCPQPASLLVWLLLIYPSNGKAEDKSAKNIRRQNFGSLSPSSRQNISYLSVWNVWPQLYRENVKFKALASGPLELWWQTIAGHSWPCREPKHSIPCYTHRTFGPTSPPTMVSTFSKSDLKETSLFDWILLLCLFLKLYFIKILLLCYKHRIII